MSFWIVPYCLRIFKHNNWSWFGFLNVLFQFILLNGMLPRVLARVVDWMRAHRQFGVEFVTHGSSTWVFIRTWKSSEFVIVAVAIIDRYYGGPSSNLKIHGKVLCAIDCGASLISLSGGSHNLVDCNKECLGSGYRKTFVDDPIFDVRLLKRCLRKTKLVVFGTLDHFSRTKFIVTCLKGRNIETGCNRGSLIEWTNKQTICLFLGS